MRSSLVTLLLCACASVPPQTSDAGTTDAGTVTIDAGTFDAGALDSGTTDAGPTDAGLVDAGMTTDGGRDPLVIARPFNLVVPVGATSAPMPLVVLLHGYTATAAAQDAYFQLTQLAQRRTFLLALPDGLIDQTGQHYWNATDACCGFGKTNDDVAYLTAVIRDVQARQPVDPKRIFLFGHSNGAFMSHRMACDRSELIAGIGALAGSVWADSARCQPTEGVAVLQVHGTLDSVIAYGGGVALVAQPPFPSARDSITTWSRKNRCTATAFTPITGNLNLDSLLLGDETDRLEFTGCPANSAAELWTINGGSHLPTLSSNFTELIFNWLMAHPKP